MLTESTIVGEHSKFLIWCPSSSSGENKTSTLTQAMNNGSLDVKDMHNILIKLVNTIAIMHAGGILHGDIDPACVHLVNGSKVL